MNKMNNEERQAYADRCREIKKNNPALTYAKIAEELGLSESHLCKLRRKFPPLPQDEDEIPQGLIDAFKEELETNEEELELVSGYIVNKNGNLLNSIPFEIAIPSGLDKRTRDIVIYSGAFEDLEIVEI